MRHSRHSLLLISLFLLVAVFAGLIATNGKIGSSAVNILRHGEIPRGDRCVLLTIPQGVTVTTSKAVAEYAHFAANDPANVDTLVNKAVEKYGDTLTHSDTPYICGSLDGMLIATIDGENLGRK